MRVVHRRTDTDGSLARAPGALLLVGHGSAHDPESGAPVRAHARRIREERHFEEVEVAFWKEPPFLRDGLELVRAEDVFVVPMFLADGYYVRQVVPREIGLEGKLTRSGARRIRYCPPVGSHPRMPELVLRRARECALLTVAERRRAALVVIGHGTERSATSAGTVQRITARLRRASEFGTVDCGFLDQEPRIERVVGGMRTRHIVLVPFFLAEGHHTRVTVPEALRLKGRRTEAGGRTLWYAAPVGTLPEIADIVTRLARQAGAWQNPRRGTP